MDDLSDAIAKGTDPVTPAECDNDIAAAGSDRERSKIPLPGKRQR